MSAPAQQPEDAQARFRDLVARPDADIDLAEAALLIARGCGHDVDIPGCLARIDALARDLRASLAEDSSEADLIVGLNRFLFEEQGFGPSVEDYYDPRNSFLDQVLERRVGIPISLSVLYIEIGRRVGLQLQGVSFPGHFLVKCELKEGSVILDPYCGGISLGIQDLQQRLRSVRGGEVSRAVVAQMLIAANNTEILARMLRNLKAIYLERGDYLRALATIEWILVVTPSQPGEIRDRGLTYLKLECFRAALADLERYLEVAPAAADRDEVRSHVVELRRSAARLN